MLLVNSSSAPPPKFKMFELAMCVFYTDEGIRYSDVVQVMGMEFNPPDTAIPGWHYHVQYVAEPSWGGMEAGFREPCEEATLHKMPHPPATTEFAGQVLALSQG